MKKFLFSIFIILIVLCCNREQPVAPPTSELPNIDAKISLAKTSETTYVFTAGMWKDKQTSAIEKAGGTLIFSHKESGIGIATSTAPDFLDRALASGAFTEGCLDEIYEWQPKTKAVECHETAITPNDEPYFGYQWNMQAMEVPAAWAEGYTGAGIRANPSFAKMDPRYPEIGVKTKS